jgi:phage tail sheath protein FI
MSTGYHHGVRVFEINEGSRPIRTVSTAVIGLIATAPDAAPEVKASLPLGNVTFTSKLSGIKGNLSTVHLRNPSTLISAENNSQLSISVKNHAILINLATDDDGVVTTTETEMVAAVNASPAASALVQATGAGPDPVIGLFKPAALSGGADEPFPLNTPVLVTNVVAAQGKAGATGTLRRVLEAIASQTKPFTVVVRVAEGKDEAETTSNVIGGVTSSGKYTGLNALLVAQSKLGIKPRILGAPFLDTPAVTNAMVAIAQRLRSFVYASCHGAQTKEEAQLYRKQFGQRELMLIWPDFITWDKAINAESTISSVAYALGLRAKTDEEIGWHKTISNLVVNGPTGISRDVYWDLQDTATDADLLNSHEITTLINNGGFRFWGSRTCEIPEFFFFENYTRTSQVLADTIAEAHSSYADKALHPSLVRDMLESINAKFREMVTVGYLIGASAWYDEAFNNKESLKAGKLIIDYDYTPVPPLEDLMFQQRITDRYLADFAANITGQ